MTTTTQLNNTNNNIKDLAYQATAYEKHGIIDYENFIQDMILEELDNMDDDEIISIFNSFTYDEAPDDTIYENDEYFFKEFYSNDPMEAVRATYYANNYNFMDPYVRFNGYGNLESLSEYEIVQEIKNDRDFADWLYNNYIEQLEVNNLYELIEVLSNNEDEIIEEALKLVNKGY